MAKRNIALLALEEDQQQEPVAPAVVPEAEVQARVDEAVDAAVVDQVVESPEADMVEMTEIATEMDDIEAAREEGVETAETLGQIEETLQASVDEGGIDPIAAEALKIAVEHMQKRIGMSQPKSGFALEGFKSKTTRIQATNAALESLQDTAKKIWEALVNTIKKIIETGKSFFGRLFDAAKKQAARADALIKAAEGKKDATVDEKATVKADGILRKDGKLLEGGELAKALAENDKELQEKVLKFVDGQMVEKFDDVVKQAVDALSKGNADEVTKKSEELASAMDVLISGFDLKDGKGVSGVLIGDRVAKVEFDKASGKASFGFEDAEGKKEVEAGENRALSPKEVIEVATEVKRQMEALVEFGKATKKIEDSQMGLFKTLVAATKGGAAAGKAAGDGSAGAQVGQQAAVLRNVVNGYISLTGSFVMKTKQYEATVGAAALSYCAASLKKVGAKAEEPAAEPAAA